MIKDDLSFLLPSLKGNHEEIKQVCLNSCEVTQGSLFIALEGQKTNGNKYIKEAIKNGATLVFSSSPNSPYYISDLKNHINEIFIRFLNLKQKVHLIGITGTNGKSSLSDFIKQLLILDKKNVKNFTVYNEKNAIKSNLTTPSYKELIYEINKNNDLDYLILECSSIGINEGRVNNLNFDYKILTNIYEDHLDYHKDIESYKNSKISFLNSTNSKIIMKRKDFLDYRNRIKEKPIIVKGNYKILKENEKGTVFIFDGKKYHTKLLGKQNLENITSLITLAKDMKIKSLKRKIKKIIPLKGRFDVVSKNPLVVIDYAHTSSSMDCVLREIKRLFSKDIILIFGAGGDREKKKRKEYGEIALKYAQQIIITNDNPRFEDENQIITDIIGQQKEKFIIQKDRSLAIRLAFSIVDEKKMIVILGKGREEYIEKEGNLIPYSDYKEVYKCLQNYPFI
ncbi:MAG: UDP-N-acetylmuramyl-tripeptide synthetase [Bacilli bacterium]